MTETEEVRDLSRKTKSGAARNRSREAAREGHSVQHAQTTLAIASASNIAKEFK